MRFSLQLPFVMFLASTISLSHALAPAAGAPAQDVTEAAAPARRQPANVVGDLAIDGYDPVSYFPEGGGAPREGRRQLTAAHRGITYRFTSEANRALFRSLPERYEPAYGGWCAWAMAKGKLVEVDPESYLIENGQLLLFYDGFFNDTRKKWLEAGGLEVGPRADKEWTKRSGETRRALWHYNLDRGLALSGFDPVSYRADRGPVRGKRAIAVVHEGVTYDFSSEENRVSFVANPAAYEPRFGGWCATAMAAGRKVPADAGQYLLEDGTLFLFANEGARKAWRERGESLRADADRRWAALQR